MTAASPDTNQDTTPFESLDWLLLGATAGIWGSSFLFIAIGLDAFEPGLVTLLRIYFGALTVLAFPSARTKIERVDLPRLWVLGFVWLAFPLTLFPIAQQWIDSSLTGMLNSAMPLMTVVVAWSVFATPTGPRRLVGVAVGFVGILIIGIPEATTAGINALGVLLVVVAVTSYGFAVNMAVPLQQKYGSLPVMARALSVATVLVLPFGLVDLPGSSFAWGPLIACLALGVGGTGIAFALAATLAGRVGAVRTSIVTYVLPVVAVVLGVVFRDEDLTLLSLVGTVIVLGGAWLSSRVD